MSRSSREYEDWRIAEEDVDDFLEMVVKLAGDIAIKNKDKEDEK